MGPRKPRDGYTIITEVSYTGNDPDLRAFANGKDLNAFVNFFFPAPGHSLRDLVQQDATVVTPFYGRFVATVPDAGNGALMMGFGVLGLPALPRCATRR